MEKQPISKHPYGFNTRDHFPGARIFSAGEGYGIFIAEKDNKFYVISDNGTLADFLEYNDPLLNELVSVYELDTATERIEWLDSQKIVANLDDI